MKVHHLNLATMCPFGGRLLTGGQRSLLGRAELVIHVLVVETPEDGLVLVDTGMGLDDVRSPERRLGKFFMTMSRPILREAQTAIRQIERLGFQRKDVRNIVVTHLDPDHAGGLVDFPQAKVHVHKAEHLAATQPSTFAERHRYRAIQLAHDPQWELHEPTEGERWFGFENVRAVGDDVLLVPLPGHTRGHSAVAVRVAEPGGPEWLLHCGDGYFFHLEKEEESLCPPLLRAFQTTMAIDNVARRANADRLRQLHKEHGSKVRLVSAHDAEELKAMTLTAS